jgi:hypothetical protein
MVLPQAVDVEHHHSQAVLVAAMMWLHTSLLGQPLLQTGLLKKKGHKIGVSDSTHSPSSNISSTPFITLHCLFHFSYYPLPTAAKRYITVMCPDGLSITATVRN